MPRQTRRVSKHTLRAQPGLVPPETQPTALSAVAAKLADLHQKNARHGTGTDAIYWTIRDAIRTGLVRPGTHLTEVDLSATLKMSRTPIREALRRLETEHLLEKSPHRGLAVPVLALNDLVDIFEVREVLFGLAARSAAQRASSTEIALMAESIARMEQAKDTGDIAILSQASAEFHEAVESASRNRRLCALIRLNSTASGLFEFGVPERIAPAIAEHRAIFDAIAAHDAKLAERLAQEHSQNAFRAHTRALQLADAAAKAGQ